MAYRIRFLLVAIGSLSMIACVGCDTRSGGTGFVGEEVDFAPSGNLIVRNESSCPLSSVSIEVGPDSDPASLTTELLDDTEDIDPGEMRDFGNIEDMIAASGLPSGQTRWIWLFIEYECADGGLGGVFNRNGPTGYTWNEQTVITAVDAGENDVRIELPPLFASAAQ
jgi:hypothetical protein